MASRVSTEFKQEVVHVALTSGLSRRQKGVLAQIIALTGIKPSEVHVDLGYRSHGIRDEKMDIILARRKRGSPRQ